MTRQLRKLYIALFLGVLGLLFVWSLRSFASYQLPPTISVLDGGLAKTFEQHYDKQFPVKDIGTNVWAALDYLLFGEGRPGVVVGERDWLYTDEEFNPVAGGEQHQRDNLAIIRGVRDELARHDVQLVLAIVPAKRRLYPEFVGERAVSSQHQALYEQFHQAVRQAGLNAPDLLARLQPAKDDGALFLRTDTHWTPQGADLVARALADAVQASVRLNGEAQAYVTQPRAEQRYKGDLTSFLPMDPLFSMLMPEQDRLQRRDTHPAEGVADNPESADALFADNQIPVALVGTSYSANPNWNFEGALREHLQRDLANYAEDGQGPIVPMLKYLNSDALEQGAPQVVIWEFPERYLPMAPDLSGFDADWVATLKATPATQRLANNP